MHKNSLLIFREHVANRIPRDGRILEIGPNARPSSYCREVGEPAGWETADLAEQNGGMTIDGSSSRILMPSEYEIPAADGSYDVVLSGQVAEHVREIWTWMRELARVTKPGGQVITISPISWGYHEVPIDCWRMYPEAMSAVSEYAGLAVEFSWWGSLEPKPSKRTFAGDGEGWETPRLRWQDRVKRALGWPLPVSYDLVTVARKP